MLASQCLSMCDFLQALCRMAERLSRRSVPRPRRQPALSGSQALRGSRTAAAIPRSPCGDVPRDPALRSAGLPHPGPADRSTSHFMLLRDARSPAARAASSCEANQTVIEVRLRVRTSRQSSMEAGESKMISLENWFKRGMWWQALVVVGLMAGCSHRTIVMGRRSDGDANRTDCVAHTSWFTVRCR